MEKVYSRRKGTMLPGPWGSFESLKVKLKLWCYLYRHTIDWLIHAKDLEFEFFLWLFPRSFWLELICFILSTLVEREWLFAVYIRISGRPTQDLHTQRSKFFLILACPRFLFGKVDLCKKIDGENFPGKMLMGHIRWHLRPGSLQI